MRNTIPADNSQDVSRLVEALHSRDPMTRRAARRGLVRCGPEATQKLIDALKSPADRVRWEAAKTLARIADSRAIGPLIDAMDDENMDVRWVAGDAMIALGKVALQPLLTALIRRADSPHFCSSAHHVLHELTRRQPDSALAQVLKALEHSNPAVMVPSVAQAACENLG